MSQQRRRSWFLLVLGLVIVTGALVVHLLTPASSSSDFAVAAPVAVTGPAPSAAASTAPAPTTGSPVAVPPAAADPSTPAPASESAAALPATRPPVPVGVPTTVQLTRLGVQAPVDPVGLTNGELQVPDDGNRLGWWTGSVVAGNAAGTTVIDGHIDTPKGRGVFYHLKDIQPNDEVVIGVAGGATLTYRVTERRTYPKAGGLPPEVFGDAHGAHRLVLITCGGPYDAVRAEYDDNVVVTAVPV